MANTINAQHKQGGAWDAVNIDATQLGKDPLLGDLTRLFEGQPFAQSIRVGGPGEIHVKMLGARSQAVPVVYVVSKGGERLLGKFTHVVRCSCANLVVEA